MSTEYRIMMSSYLVIPSVIRALRGFGKGVDIPILYLEGAAITINGKHGKVICQPAMT